MKITILLKQMLDFDNKCRIETFTFIFHDAIIKSKQEYYLNISKGDKTMSLRGTKAIVTGGSRGIGFAIAGKLKEAGASVVINGKNEQRLREAAEKLGVQYLAWDVADISIMQEKFDACVAMLGGCDIFVNNAGVLTSDNEWGLEKLYMREQEWDRVMNINLKGAYFMMQTAVRYMYENKIQGNVLNVNSVAATEPLSGPYGASKAGMFGLTRGWGKDFAPYGIVINGIAPGPIATDMNNWHEGDSLRNDRIPSGRFGTADEVASLAMYLLSEEASQIIGHSVICDGAYDIK